MTVNISCCFIVAFSALIFGRSCFSVIHLLWINMIMDTFAALALATEPPSKNNLKSRPVKGNQTIMNEIMWRQILSQSIYQIVVLLIMLFLAPLMFGFSYHLFADQTPESVLKHNTIVFTTFVYLQLVNFFNCRKLGAREINIFENFFNNWIFLFMVVGLFAAQYALVTFGNKLFQVEALSVSEHLICLAFALGSLLVCLGVKYTPEELAKKIP